MTQSGRSAPPESWKINKARSSSGVDIAIASVVDAGRLTAGVREVGLDDWGQLAAQCPACPHRRQFMLAFALPRGSGGGRFTDFDLPPFTVPFPFPFVLQEDGEPDPVAVDVGAPPLSVSATMGR